MSAQQIADLEMQIWELSQQLYALRKAETGTEVPDYSFDTLQGPVKLSELFAAQDKLLAIHNMGQGCRYCTLWADGFNGLLSHLENALSVVVLSKDDPAMQRRLANARGWRFRMASHGGGSYMTEQSVNEEAGNFPGAVCYQLRDGKIYRLNSCQFGPGDLYCAQWGLLALAGLDTESWTPQFNYWRRPQQLDDGGANVVD